MYFPHRLVRRGTAAAITATLPLALARQGMGSMSRIRAIPPGKPIIRAVRTYDVVPAMTRYRRNRLGASHLIGITPMYNPGHLRAQDGICSQRLTEGRNRGGVKHPSWGGDRLDSSQTVLDHL